MRRSSRWRRLSGGRGVCPRGRNAGRGTVSGNGGRGVSLSDGGMGTGDGGSAATRGGAGAGSDDTSGEAAGDGADPDARGGENTSEGSEMPCVPSQRRMTLDFSAKLMSVMTRPSVLRRDIEETIPTIAPCRFRSGPPEFPRLILASVCHISLPETPWKSASCALITPVVKVQRPPVSG